MSKTHPAYPPEFRQRMVASVRAGRSPGELSREFEPCAEAVRQWLAQAGRGRGDRTEEPTSNERDALERLKHDKRRPRRER